jgi:hypothetical protein
MSPEKSSEFLNTYFFFLTSTHQPQYNIVCLPPIQACVYSIEFKRELEELEWSNQSNCRFVTNKFKFYLNIFLHFL